MAPGAPAAPARLAHTPSAPAPAAATVAAVGAVATSASLQEVLRRIAAKGPEYEALAELARPLIEQMLWEVVPELVEAILLENQDKLSK